MTRWPPTSIGLDLGAVRDFVLNWGSVESLCSMPKEPAGKRSGLGCRRQHCLHAPWVLACSSHSVRIQLPIRRVPGWPQTSQVRIDSNSAAVMRSQIASVR